MILSVILALIVGWIIALLCKPKMDVGKYVSQQIDRLTPEQIHQLSREHMKQHYPNEYQKIVEAEKSERN